MFYLLSLMLHHLKQLRFELIDTGQDFLFITLRYEIVSKRQYKLFCKKSSKNNIFKTYP